MKLTRKESQLVKECVEDAIYYHRDKMNFNRVRQIQQLYDKILEDQEEAELLIPEQISSGWGRRHL